MHRYSDHALMLCWPAWSGGGGDRTVEGRDRDDGGEFNDVRMWDRDAFER